MLVVAQKVYDFIFVKKCSFWTKPILFNPISFLVKIVQLNYHQWRGYQVFF